MLRAWIQSTRPLAQANIALPLVLGQALAFRVTGDLDWSWALAIHAFGLLDQLFIVWGNDYADAEADALNQGATLFSGGSRVVPDGKLPRGAVGVAAALAALALLGLSGAAAASGRPLAPAFGLAAVFLLWAYSFPPLRLAYRGKGEWLQALGLGVVLPAYAFYLQAGSLGGFPWFALIPAAVLGYAGNVTTALPDAPADTLADKRTVAVLRGERFARQTSLALLLASGLLAVVFGPALRAPWAILVVLVPAALAALNLRDLPVADASNRRACLRFVIINGAAIQGTLLVWSLALLW